MCRGDAVPHFCNNLPPGPLGECNEILVDQPADVEMDVKEDSGLLNAWGELCGVARQTGWGGKRFLFIIDIGLFAMRATYSVNSREYPAIAFAS